MPSPPPNQSDPVLLSAAPTDRVDIVKLARSSDPAFNKIMVTLAALCEEVSFLRATAEAKFYAQLMFFGHSKNDDAEEWAEGMLEAQVGVMLPLLQDAANFVRRVHAVVAAIVAQLRALFSRGGGFLAGFTATKLTPLVLALGDALRVLLTLDAVLRASRLIAPAWERFKRLADIMRLDPGKYGADVASAGDFEALLAALDRGLLAATNFQQGLDQNFGDDVPSDFREWLRARAIEQLGSALRAVGGDAETGEALEAVGQFCVYALYRALAVGRVESKALAADFTMLWKVTERLPLVPLWGAKVVWLPDEFLASFAAVPGIVPAKLVPRDPRVVRAAAADAAEAALPALVNIMHARLAAWLVRATSVFSDTPLAGRTSAPEALRARALLLTQAVVLAHMAGRTLETLIALTLFLERPVKRRCVEPLARCAELCKALEGALRAHAAPVATALPSILRESNAALIALVAPLQLRASAARAKVLGDPVARFIAAATEVVVDLATSSETWSPPRRIMLELALSVTTQADGLSKAPDIEALSRAGWTLRVLSDYAGSVRVAANTASLYWVRELIPAMVGAVAAPGGSAPHDLDCRAGARLPYLFAALSDAARWLAAVVHLPPPPPPARRIVSDVLLVSALSAGADAADAAAAAAAKKGAPPPPDRGLAGVEHPLTAYERFLCGVLTADIIAPLARAIEADLRVKVHAVHLSHMEPPLLRGRGPPLVHLLACPPFRVVSAVIDVRAEVTRYLEKTFYELTTVALHDWKT
jgi:WASH complex subunit 7